MRENINILYVDDEEINLHLFNAGFKRKFNVHTASSGKEALVLLKDIGGVDVVISDMKMPEMNGIEFIKKAKLDFSNVRYFILTAFDITDDIKEALENNLIHQYLRKPINFTEVEKYIRGY